MTLVEGEISLSRLWTSKPSIRGIHISNYHYPGMMNLRMTQESVRVDEPFYLPTCRREKAAGRFQHRRVIVEQPVLDEARGS